MMFMFRVVYPPSTSQENETNQQGYLKIRTPLCIEYLVIVFEGNRYRSEWLTVDYDTRFDVKT